MARKYPAVVLLLPVLFGIVATDLFSLSPYPPLVLGAVAVLVGFLMVGQGRATWAAAVFCLAVASLAAFHFGIRYVHHGPDHLSSILTEPIPAHVFGEVSDWPELKTGRTEIVVGLDSLIPPGEVAARVVSGAVLLKVTDTSTVLQRGDRVSLRARLYPVTDSRRAGFDYGRYLRLQGVGAIAYLPTLLSVTIDKRAETGPIAVIDYVRDAITSSFDRNLSLVSAALAKGFLIGETRDIPPDLYGRFRDSGTLHLLAVSGSNVALVLLFVLWATRPFRLGRVARNLTLLLVIGLFAGLSYGDPSVVRASVMAVIVLGARLLGRPVNLHNGIATTALIVLAVDPAQLFDVGFQLSFVTAWGLILVVPLVSQKIGRSTGKLWVRWILLPLLVTLTAQIVSAPIIAYYFGRLPLLGPVANLIVVPMVSVAVFGLMILLLANLVWPILAALVGSLLDLWLRWTVTLIDWMGGADIAVWSVSDWFGPPFGVVAVLAGYLIIGLAALSLSQRQARRWLLITTVVIANGILAIAIMGSFQKSDSQISVDRVSGGVAAVIHQPGNDRGDLLISGLRSQDYGLDSTVIKTVLTERGLVGLERLALLTPEYSVVDDLYRAAHTYRVERLLLPASLKATVDDYLRDHPDGEAVAVRFFGDRRIPWPTGDGIRFGTGSCEIRAPGLQAVLVDRVADLASILPDSTLTSILVIGQIWQPAAPDWLQHHRDGWDMIVCSRIEQQSAGERADPEFDQDRILPEYLIDLSRTGHWSRELAR